MSMVPMSAMRVLYTHNYNDGDKFIASIVDVPFLNSVFDPAPKQTIDKFWLKLRPLQ